MIIGSLLVVCSAIGFGLIPIFAIYAYDYGLNVFTLLFLRFLVAAIVFFGWLLLRKKLQRLSVKQFLSIVLLGGVFYTAQSTFYFTAVMYIPASLAVLLLYLFPIVVAILSFVINREKITLGVILSMLLSLTGILLTLGTPSGEIEPLGVFLALGAAICLAFYVVLGNRLTSNIPTDVMSGYLSLFASLSFLLIGLLRGELDFSFDYKGWIPIIGIALFSTVMSIFTLFAGMKYIGPTKASIVSMIEPVVTILLSALLLSERLTIVQGIGAVIVITGAILVFVLRSRTESIADSSSLET